MDVPDEGGALVAPHPEVVPCRRALCAQLDRVPPYVPRDSSHVINGADQPPGGHLAATPTPSTARDSATR